MSALTPEQLKRLTVDDLRTMRAIVAKAQGIETPENTESEMQRAMEAALRKVLGSSAHGPAFARVWLRHASHGTFVELGTRTFWTLPRPGDYLDIKGAAIGDSYKVESIRFTDQPPYEIVPAIFAVSTSALTNPALN